MVPPESAPIPNRATARTMSLLEIQRTPGLANRAGSWWPFHPVGNLGGPGHDVKHVAEKPGQNIAGLGLLPQLSQTCQGDGVQVERGSGGLENVRRAVLRWRRLARQPQQGVELDRQRPGDAGQRTRHELGVRNRIDGQPPQPQQHVSQFLLDPQPHVLVGDLQSGKGVLAGQDDVVPLHF